VSGEDVSGRGAGGEAADGETVGGETVGGETVGGETVGGETVGGETVGGETVGGETVGDASASADEAAWRDLVARYDMPAADPPDAVPWPDREGLAPPACDEGPAGRTPGSERTRVIRPAAPSAPSPVLPPADAEAVSPGEKDDAEEHYVPPPPPPLPHLDPVTKGAWTALFGGPAYLLAATLIGWPIPGWAALLAVVAFVGGFALIVLRLGDGPSRGAGPDNGAVL